MARLKRMRLTRKQLIERVMKDVSGARGAGIESAYKAYLSEKGYG